MLEPDNVQDESEPQQNKTELEQPTKVRDGPVENVRPFVPKIKTCASCNGDFSRYTGEIQVLGEHTYHSACLKRESLKQSGQSTGSHHPASTSFGDDDTPADVARKLPEKIVVKLSIEDDCYQREYLCATFFEWSNKQESLAKIKKNEQSKRMERFLRNDDSTVDLSLEIPYDLDASAFGNPNYTGNFSSHLSGLPQKYSPRKTTVAFPRYVKVDEDGRICTDLIAELQWIGQPSPVSLNHVSSHLTIEPYPYEDSPVRKILNQLWRYKVNSIYHEFQFSVPFKGDSRTLGIYDGDEIDLTECRFDAFLEQADPESQVKMPSEDPMKLKTMKRGSMLTKSITSNPPDNDWESRADQLIHEDNSQPSRIVSKSVPPPRSRRLSASVYQQQQYLQEHSTRLDPDGDEITNVSLLVV